MKIIKITSFALIFAFVSPLVQCSQEFHVNKEVPTAAPLNRELREKIKVIAHDFIRQLCIFDSPEAAIKIAEIKGHEEEVVKFLGEAGFDCHSEVDASTLPYRGVWFCKTLSVTQELLRAGARPNYQILESGETTLHNETQGCRLDQISLLFEHRRIQTFLQEASNEQIHKKGRKEGNNAPPNAESDSN